MRVYLDICCFNRPFDDQSQLRIRLEAEAKIAIQEKIRSGGIELAWSYMMDFENDANPYEERRESISPWRSLAVADTTESRAILSHARTLHGFGFKNQDALHLACAISLSCDAFLTTDDRILSRKELVTKIAILNPIDYATANEEPE